jgi:transcriptional regulator with XRE-family HTH domain
MGEAIMRFSDIDRGTRLAIARLEQGMTQREAAEKAGISGAALCQIERGEYDGKSGTVARILFVYGLNRGYLD